MVEPRFADPGGIGAFEDCWRQIGVQGDGSCPRLAEHIHCRNCPVHARAAVALLDQLPVVQEAPGEAARDATRASPPSSPADLSCLVFRVGPEWLALPAPALTEVSPPCPLHTLPHRRNPAVLGLASVRGTLLVCISLARLLGIAADESAVRPGELPAQADAGAAAHQARGPVTPGSRLLIMGHGRDALAMPVDQIAAVERVATAALKPLPTTVVRTAGHLTQGLLDVSGRTVGLLDAALLQQAMLRSAA